MIKKRVPSGRDANIDTPHMSAARQKLYAASGRGRPWWMGTALPETIPDPLDLPVGANHRKPRRQFSQIREQEEQPQKVLAEPKSD